MQVKKLNRNKTAWLLGAGLLLSASMQADATTFTGLSDFASNVSVTYTVDSVTNTTHPGVGGLDMSMSYHLDTDPDSESPSEIYIPAGSDAQFTPFTDLPDYSASVTLGTPKTHAISVSGAVNNGTGEAYYNGLFDLFMNNTTQDSFDVQVTVSYQLDGTVSGQHASNEIGLTTWRENDADNCFDADTCFEDFSYSDTSVPVLQHEVTGEHTFNFTIDPESNDYLYANVTDSALLQASPVPLPAAFWLFASSLIIPAFRKTRQA